MQRFRHGSCGQTQDKLEIQGEAECKDFLTQYRDHILTKLIAQIKLSNRKELVLAAAGELPSSALGAIKLARNHYCPASDPMVGKPTSMRFKRQNAVNAVQRAAKVVCGIAACEAPVDTRAYAGL